MHANERESMLQESHPTGADYKSALHQGVPKGLYPMHLPVAYTVGAHSFPLDVPDETDGGTIGTDDIIESIHRGQIRDSCMHADKVVHNGARTCSPPRRPWLFA